jgi:hypothetical protein
MTVKDFPSVRRLLKVQIDDAIEADRAITMRIGGEVQPRRQFIGHPMRIERYLFEGLMRSTVLQAAKALFVIPAKLALCIANLNAARSAN